MPFSNDLLFVYVYRREAIYHTYVYRFSWKCVRGKKNSLQNIHKKPLNKMKNYCETEENAHKESQFVLWKMVLKKKIKKRCVSRLCRFTFDWK